MDTTFELVRGSVLDPVVVTSAAAISALLLSGAAARAIELNERRASRRERRAANVGAG